MLHLRTLGGLSLASDDGVLSGAAGQRRPLALLAILAVAGEHGIGRERLQTLLWPESDAERARKALAQTIYAVRRDLGDPGVVVGTADLRLNPSLVMPDVVQFEGAMDAGQPERAIVLYAGPFLDGVHLGDAPEFERWADGERHRFARRALGAIEQLACAAEQRGEWEVAIGWRHRLAALDPLNGRAAARLMEALAAAGDIAGALRHARVHETLLREELGASPDAGVAALAERLRTPTKAATSVPTSVAPPAASSIPASAVSTATASGSPHAAPTEAPRAPTLADASSEVVRDNGVAPEGGRIAEMPAGTTGRREAAPDLANPAPSAGSGDIGARDEDTVSPQHLVRGELLGRRQAKPQRRWWPLTAFVFLALLVVAAAARVLGPGAADLDRALIVVVPFDAADAPLRLWSEGLVDVLSRNLDGAGPLRTVSPTTVVRRWGGRADRTAVRDFARELGAGTAVYGAVLRAGTDSVRVSLTVLDVRTARRLAEVRQTDAVAHMDRLTDSLTVDVIGAVGRTVPSARPVRRRSDQSTR